jgi:hypothetical protein
MVKSMVCSTLNLLAFGDDEDPGVELDLFKTDYFTHRVFRSIFHELKSKNHKISSAGLSDFLSYKPFLTSFGINTLLICEWKIRRKTATHSGINLPGNPV